MDILQHSPAGFPLMELHGGSRSSLITLSCWFGVCWEQLPLNFFHPSNPAFPDTWPMTSALPQGGAGRDDLLLCLASRVESTSLQVGIMA